MRQETSRGSDCSINRRQVPYHLRRPLRLILVMGAVFTLLVTASASVMASPLGVQEDPDSTVREEDRSDSRVEIALKNGNQLSLVPMYNEDGKIEGYGVIEKTGPGNVEVARMDDFRELDPAELMSALTGDEAKIPQQMIDLYGQPTHGARGWGLGLVPGPSYGTDEDDTVSCYLAGAFDNDFPGYQHTFTTYYDGPDTVPAHWLPSGGGEFHTWGRVYDVRQYYTKVTRCNVDEDQFIWGPHVYVSSRNNQNYPAWGVAFFDLGYLDEFGSSTSFTWHPIAPSSQYDFQVSINNVLNDDTFHIGIEWSNPFGYKIS